MSDAPSGAGRKRFSALRVLAVLGLLGVLVLVYAYSVDPAISGGRHPVSRNETAAIGCLRNYVHAQMVFRQKPGDGEKEFARPFTVLKSKSGSGDAAGSVSQRFLAARGPGGTPLDGYLFADIENLAGMPVQAVHDFALCATPAEYGRTGCRTFIVATDGVVWSKDLRKPLFVRDLPADPESDGWSRCD